MTFNLMPVFGIAIDSDVLFFVVFGIFALIKFLTSRGKKDEEQEPEISDEEQVRRTREIQEEIRRRIAANRSSSPSRAPTPQPRVSQPPASIPRRVQTPMQVPLYSDEPEIVIGNHIDYMEQLAEARRTLEQSRHKADAVLTSAKLRRDGKSATGTVRRDGVLAMLGSSNGLRDAFIISEVLSQPLSERRDSSCPGLIL